MCAFALGRRSRGWAGARSASRKQEAQLKNHLLFHVIILTSPVGIKPSCHFALMHLACDYIPELALGSGGGKGKGSEVLQTWKQMLSGFAELSSILGTLVTSPAKVMSLGLEGVGRKIRAKFF